MNQFTTQQKYDFISLDWPRFVACLIFLIPLLFGFPITHTIIASLFFGLTYYYLLSNKVKKE